MAKRVVLAYSGGLDTSVAVKWMIENQGVEVIALAVDVGQSSDDWDVVRERARAAGAVEAMVVDAREEFARDYCMPALRANALYEDRYPLVSALSRPLIVKHLVAAARQHGADAVAHGCTGKGNDQVRFEVSTRALAPDLDVVAPVRSWGMTREDCIHYAYDHGIPITATKEKVYSIDDNLWGRAIECGEMEDPWAVPPPGVWLLTKPTATEPTDVVVAFDEGVPVALDDEELAPARADRPPRRAGRLLRLGPHRHGREPPGRHQEPRDLRVPGEPGADAGPRRPRDDLPRARPGPREGAHVVALRRAGLRRPVVQPAAPGLRRLRGREPEVRDRRGAPAPHAGLVPGHRPAQPQEPLRLRPRHLRRRRQLPPRGQRRLRAPVGPRHRDLVGHPGPGSGSGAS